MTRRRTSLLHLHCIFQVLLNLMGGDLIYDFTAATFSMKSAIISEKCVIPWNTWFSVNISVFSCICKDFQNFYCCITHWLAVGRWQVWKNRKVWEGFVKCCQRTKPQSFLVLLQLPAVQLRDAFSLCPELREPLHNHIQTLTPHQVSIALVVPVHALVL